MDIETAIRLRFSAIRSGLPNGVPITVLYIGEEQTVVASGSGITPGVLMGAILALPIGSRKTATDHFKHESPTPLEMENAIVTVEDELARARTMIVAGSKLFPTDVAIREIARLAGVADNAEQTLSLDATERTFERLAAVTLGKPASQEGIPTSPAFAATLLILREFMHHLRFLSITVKA
jgi:exopolyphosphatase/pppGpp-phosphohydrolase